MKTSQEIKAQREKLREQISVETSEIKKEMLREQVFCLDEILGVFDSGLPKTQTELFTLLQTAQTQKVADWNEPNTHEELKTVGCIKMYKWVMGSI